MNNITEAHLKDILLKVLVPSLDVQNLLDRFAASKKFTYHQLVYDYDRTVGFTKVSVYRRLKNENILMVSRIDVIFDYTMGSSEIECWMKPKDNRCRDSDRQYVLEKLRLLTNDSFIDKYLRLKNEMDEKFSRLMSVSKQHNNQKE